MDHEAAVAAHLGLSLIRQLHSRDDALNLLLRQWLPFQPDITDYILKRLLAGLFFCVWYANRHARPMINCVSSVVPRLHNSSISLHYFSSFLLTMRRVWPRIDAPRLGNFHHLIRRFLHYSLAFLGIHSWDLDLTSRLISHLEDTCFLVKECHSFGISYHIADVFLEELTPFLPLRPEVLEVVFKPFISVLGSLPDEVLSGKIKSNMFDVLLKMGNKLLEVKKLGDDNDNDDSVVLGTIALTMGFSSKFGELVSSVEGNREDLFVLYEQFLKLEKDLESSGIQVSIPRPVEREQKPLKKKKKQKKASGGKKGKKKKNVAAEAGLNNDAVEDVASACELPKTEVNGTVSNKRKRAERMKGQKSPICVEIPERLKWRTGFSIKKIGTEYYGSSCFFRNPYSLTKIGTEYIDDFYCTPL